MYRVGRRTRRISDGKLTPRLSDRRRVTDADDDDDAVEIGDMKLTPEEVQGLLELLPYKEALIKIAKGEFEIEKVEEADEEEADEDAEGDAEGDAEEGFEEDEDFSEDETGEGEDEEDIDYDDEEDDTEAVDDSALNDAWKKRLAGNKE